LKTPEPIDVADADIFPAVEQALRSEDAPDVLLTSGGTGISSDDLTVEAFRRHIDKEMPGIDATFWNKWLAKLPTAALSRCIAGVAGSTFVMTLPGSTGGVKDGCAVLEEILGHIITTMEGNNDH